MATQVCDDTYSLVYAAVLREEQLFRHFPDLGEEDRVQECMIAVEHARPSFNAAKGRWSTFVSNICKRRQIDLWRVRSRRAEREAKYASGGEYQRMDADNRTGEQGRRVPVYHGDRVIFEDPPAPLPEGHGEVFEGLIVRYDDEQPLHDWLGEVYRTGSRATAGLSRERRTYEHAQEYAVAAIADRLKLSTRGTRGLFEDRPELCKAIGFPPLPSHRWFATAIADCTLIPKKYFPPK